MTRDARERLKGASTNTASARLPPEGLRSNSKKPSAPWWRVLGPGIVSGASDNDPTTVASLAVIGSTTVYGLSWLVLLIIPIIVIPKSASLTPAAPQSRCLKRSCWQRKSSKD